MSGKSFIQLFSSLLLAVTLCLPAVVPARAQPGTLRFESLSVEDGLSQSTVQAILQDSKGFMWFGTQDGLNKYDGYTFTIYKHDPDNPQTISDNSILTIFEDSNGILWLGTARGLNRFDSQNETFTRYQHDPKNLLSLNGSAVTSILEDPSGRLWVATEDGLNRLNDDKTFVHYQHYPDRQWSLSGNQVSAMILDPKGGMWVGSSAGLDFYDFETNQFIHYHHDPNNSRSLSSNQILCLFLDRYGLLWVGTEDGGLNRFNVNDKTFTRYRTRTGNPYSLVSDDIRTIFEDSKGRLWVGTRKALHLFERREDYFIRYTHDPKDPHSLSSDYILSLYEDRSGVFWIGTFSGGLNKYNQTDDRFLLFKFQPGVATSLSDNMVQTLIEDSDGVVWVGTMDGGLNRMESETQTFKAYTHNPIDTSTIGSNDVRALLEDRNGVLWVGTYGGGLNRFNHDTGRFSRYRHDSNNAYSLGDDRVLSLHEDRRGTLWVGTQSSGLYWFERRTGRFHQVPMDNEDLSRAVEDPVRVIYEDQQGFLWIGTNSGISVMNPETHAFEHYQNNPTDPTSLSSDRVLSFYQSADGMMWIGTIQGGLNRFDPAAQTFRHYTQKHGLPNDTIFGILPDHAGQLWLATNMGLSRFDPLTEKFRNYDVRDGLQSNEFNQGAYFRTKRGVLYFGGVKGFNVFDPRTLADNPVAPQVIITAFKKFNQTERKDLSENENIVLSYQDNFISFEFAALDYSTPNKNQYAYKLEGFDRDWVYAGTRRFTTYTNLKGGDYVFRVKGANKDGVWNETGTSIRIHVTPPVWEQWWFNVALVILLAGSAAGFLWLRVRRIQDQQIKLEELVRERTSQIERSAAEIERRRQVAEGLREILAILNSNLSLKECLDCITDQAIRLMGAQAVVIFRCGEEDVPVVVAYNLPGRYSPALSSNGSGLPVIFSPEWISSPVLQGKALIIQDVAAFTAAGNALNPGSIPFHEDINSGEMDDSPSYRWENVLLQDYRAMLAVPLLLNDEIDGGLLLAYAQPRLFSEEDQQTAASFADHAALAIANARLRTQAEELAVTAERSRLARDLHDAVTQTLFATSLIADVLPRLWERNPQAGKQKLEEVRELTRGALAEMRTLLMELRPTALEDVPLPDLLQQLCEAFTGRARVPVNLNLDRTIVMPPNVKIGFYRIAQEALNNVSKHARARRVEIRLSKEDDRVQMLILDDGIGFDPHRNLPDHFGLGIMEERAETVGANYNIQSQVGMGTQIRVEWEPEIERRQAG